MGASGEKSRRHVEGHNDIKTHKMRAAGSSKRAAAPRSLDGKIQEEGAPSGDLSRNADVF